MTGTELGSYTATDLVRMFVWGHACAHPRFLSTYQLAGAALFFAQWTREGAFQMLANACTACYDAGVLDDSRLAAFDRASTMLEDLAARDGARAERLVYGRELYPAIVSDRPAPVASGWLEV